MAVWIWQHNLSKCRSRWPCYLRPIACWDGGFEFRRGRGRLHGCLSLVSVVCCQVKVSASGRSPVQRSLTDCGCVRVCDLETLAMRRPWPALGCCVREKIYIQIYIYIYQLRPSHLLTTKRIPRDLLRTSLSWVLRRRSIAAGYRCLMTRPETSVSTYHTVWCNVSKERRRQPHRGGSLERRRCYMT